jgi:cytochrome P450
MGPIAAFPPGMSRRDNHADASKTDWGGFAMAHVRLPEFVARHGPGDPDPYENLAWLREAMPVATVPGPDGEGTVWLVTTHAEARACLADRRLSHDRRHAGKPGDGPEDHGDLLGKDPPDHTRLRHLVSPILSPGATERLRPRVIETCTALIDEFAGRGRADLVADYSWPIPWAVIHDYYGIPEDQRLEVSRCIDRFLVAGYTEAPYGGGPATDELMAYVRDLIEYKRHHRGDDVTTIMIEGLERGVVHSEAELEGMLYVLLGAGMVSTGPLIAAAGLRLLQHPDELAKLLDGSLPWKIAVEESLRYDSPVQTSVNRWAVEDITFGDTTVKKGDAVVISLAAANRDPARFADAERFAVEEWRSHLAFGHGIHLCVGAPLARLEGEVALELLFSRLPDLRLAEPAEDLAWVLGPKLRSPREVPVLFDPA